MIDEELQLHMLPRTISSSTVVLSSLFAPFGVSEGKFSETRLMDENTLLIDLLA